jgi:hypothetical protein
MKMEKHETFGMVGNPSKLTKKPGKWRVSFFIAAAGILALIIGILLQIYL